MTYTEAIDILKKAVADGTKFEETHIEWGMDLGSEHERCGHSRHKHNTSARAA